MIHAGCYSATLPMLKAVAEMGIGPAKGSGADVVARMKAMPTEDDAFGPGMIRGDGGRVVPSYLFEVKKPEESSRPWDDLKLIQTMPADEAFRPMSEGGCGLVRS